MKRLSLLALVLFLAWPASAQSPKPGGVLNLRLREDLPAGFAIHESPTISTLWPSQPCFSNLVLFDPATGKFGTAGTMPRASIARWQTFSASRPRPTS